MKKKPFERMKKLSQEILTGIEQDYDLPPEVASQIEAGLKSVLLNLYSCGIQRERKRNLDLHLQKIILHRKQLDKVLKQFIKKLSKCSIVENKLTEIDSIF